MTSLVSPFGKFTELGAHVHIFCTPLQYRDSFDVLYSIMKCPHEEDGEGQEQELLVKMFAIESKSPVYIQLRTASVQNKYLLYKHD